MYIFGGIRVGGGYRNSMYEVNLTNAKINEMVDENHDTMPPKPRAFHRAFAYGTKIIYYGGLNDAKIYNNYCTFNTTTKKWTHVKTKNTPTPREHFSFDISIDNSYGF